MIKALASYQFGPGASPGVDVILYLVTDHVCSHEYTEV